MKLKTQNQKVVKEHKTIIWIKAKSQSEKLLWLFKQKQKLKISV